MIPEGLQQIDEEVIEASNYHAGEWPNSFSVLLDKAKVFREQGLTPVYLFDPILKIVELSTEEKLKNRLN